MKKEIREMLHSQSQLQEILGVSRVQAWRIWNGKSVLTEANERLVVITINNLTEKREKAEVLIDEWVKTQRNKSKGEFYISKTKEGNRIYASVSFIDCDETNSHLTELIDMHEDAQHESTRDLLLDAYIREVESWKFSEKEVIYK